MKELKLFDLDPNLRWLFCMTHPDDEISVCAWIHALARNGNPVYLSWTHSSPIREAEARAAATLMTVPLENLRFFGATDGRACFELGALLPKFRDLMDEVRPDRVVTGAFEQGHIDHDATNYLVNATYSGPVLETPFYHTYARRLQRMNRFSSSEGEEIRTLDEGDQKLKKLIARQYPSQNIWQILFWHEVFSKAGLRHALPTTERLRLQTHRHWLVPNHPPRVAKRVMRTAPWKRWCECLGNWESKRLIDSAEPAPTEA